MALNTTIGSPDGDSMITVAEADLIIATSFPNDVAEWDDAEEAVKEQMLKAGALFFFYLPLRGSAAYDGQAMPFPRTCQTDITVIPQAIKDAQAEISFNVAFRAFKAQTPIALGASTAAQVKKLSLGGLLSIDFSNTGDASGGVMEQFTRGLNSLTWMKLVKYISQIRGTII